MYLGHSERHAADDFGENVSRRAVEVGASLLVEDLALFDETWQLPHVEERHVQQRDEKRAPQKVVVQLLIVRMHLEEGDPHKEAQNQNLPKAS